MLLMLYEPVIRHVDLGQHQYMKSVYLIDIHSNGDINMELNLRAAFSALKDRHVRINPSDALVFVVAQQLAAGCGVIAGRTTHRPTSCH